MPQASPEDLLAPAGVEEGSRDKLLLGRFFFREDSKETGDAIESDEFGKRPRRTAIVPFRFNPRATSPVYMLVCVPLV